MKRGIKLVHGVGLNDADYNTTSPDRCPIYAKWCDMLMRCYSDSYQRKNKKYRGCYVDKKWFSFMSFKSWMESQEWEGKELDKDVLGDGKLYSAETCCFISRDLNAFIVGHKIGELTGASWHSGANKFVASCRNPFTKKSKNLGLFMTEIEAHLAWKRKKLEHAIKLLEKESDNRVIEAIKRRYE